MAIISIPNSIGGISVPGGILNGPLGALFGKTNQNVLQYPNDLANNPTKAHSVLFTIQDIQPNTLKESSLFSVGTEGSLSQQITAKLNPPLSTTTDSITLYMPDTLNMSYNASWTEFSLTENLGTMGKIVNTALDAYESKGSGWPDKIKNTLTGPAALEVAGSVSDAKLGTKSAGDTLLRAGGYAVNPQLQLMYQGIGLRSFQLDFTFTPKSQTEAQTVKKIVDRFTLAFLPKLQGAVKNSNGGGQYFVMPSVFQIKFQFHGAPTGALNSAISSVLGNLGAIGSSIASSLPGQSTNANENLNLYKLGNCVLDNINVDYAPNGWAAYSDGAPVQTKLTLSFKETDIMHRDLFNSGKVR